MQNIKENMFNKNPMLVLSYLSKNVFKDNISLNVANELSLSAGSVHTILKQFETLGLVAARRLGKSVIYSVDKENPIIKSFRVFDNLLDVKELVEQLKPHSRKIILFGSCARGEDNAESDIDLLVLADETEKDTVMKIVSEYKLEREIKPVIFDIIEFMEMEKNDAVFYKEIMKGIQMWEASDE
ncbi:MAG: nucleotidyltransferase domain-containing protein [Ignavibacteriales bacterium]